MTLNKDDRRQLEKLAILEMAMKGATYREISKTLNVSMGHISSILHDIAVEARDQIEQKWFLETIPLATKISLLKLDAMDKVAWRIVDTSKDDRVVLQALSCISVQDSRRKDILLSTEVIDRAISAQKSSLIAKEIDTINRQQQQKTDDSHTNGNTNHTSEQLEEGSNGDGASENRVISDSQPDCKEGGQGDGNNV